MYSDDQVAQVCHDAIRAMQFVQGDPVPSRPWDSELDEIKASAVEGVRGARSGSTPQQLHENWVKFKQSRGWTYGPVKDAERKTHPNLVPYDQLPREQRDKDRLFRMIVRSMTNGVP